MKFKLDGISKKLVWVFIAFFVVSISCFPLMSEDLFMYLAIAREYFKTGAFPATDPFLYSIPNFPWTIMHQWLGYLVFYGLYQLGDFDLIIILKSVLITAVFCFPLWRLRKSSQATWIWGLSVLIASYAMSFRMMERTSFFSDLFIVAVLNILMAEQIKPSRWKYILPVIFLLWVNLHPGFPLGWFLCGIFLFVNIKKWRKAEYRKLAALVLFSVLVCFINPRGVDGFLYPFNFIQNEGPVYRIFYFEWMPTLHPMFRGGDQNYFIFALVIWNVILLFLARRQKPFFEFIASAFFIFYGFYAIRFVPSFCFAIVTLNASLALETKPFKIQFKYLNLALAAVALALAVKNVGWGYETISGHRDFGLGTDPHIVPEEAAKLLDQSGLKANIYNSHLYGSYLAWAWEGHRKLLYHGFVTDSNFFVHEYLQFGAGRDQFDSQVKKFNIGAFFLDRFKGNEGLLSILTQHSDWQLVYKDEGALIFLKKQ
jgi:hypothetical protein